jgi:Zn-finger nucleic acid-binding protein
MNLTALACPKCHGDMRAYERNGVTIEQCTDCRGLFLDRGELERLIAAEDQHYGARRDDRGSDKDRDKDRDRYRSDRDDRDRGYRRDDDDDDRYRGGYGGQPQRKRSSFLGELLDFG